LGVFPWSLGFRNCFANTYQPKMLE
jgi:hypothetical protein